MISTRLLFILLATLLTLMPMVTFAAPPVDPPVRLAIVGLVHGHVDGFLAGLKGRTDVTLVGVSDPDAALLTAYRERPDLAGVPGYTDVAAMLDVQKPQAVAIFSSTFDHPQIVALCAARGIDVMMEKPLAVSMEHALAIRDAARVGGIEVMVNYETTWYPSHARAFALVDSARTIGALRKFVVRDGHEGPREIGVQPQFLTWLTDPVRNGGGALTDFGCYGANLITWLLHNRRPTSVSAITQQLKSDPVYARVDDEATIILNYPDAVGVVQASWNWPFGRKDMDLYGEGGYIRVLDAREMQVRVRGSREQRETAPALSGPDADPVSYLVAIAKGQKKPQGLSSLENNLIVTEILDAARRSAREGITVVLPEVPVY